MSCEGGTSLSLISKADSSGSIGHQPNREVQEGSRRAKDFDCYANCRVKKCKKSKAKQVDCDNIFANSLWVHVTILMILPRMRMILWTYGINVAVNGDIVITLTCHAELTHSRT